MMTKYLKQIFLLFLRDKREKFLHFLYLKIKLSPIFTQIHWNISLFHFFFSNLVKVIA